MQSEKVMTSLLHKTLKDSVKPIKLNQLNLANIERADLAEAYLWLRHSTEILIADLNAEDQNIQPMDDASPIKWHRAHTTWFFETFVLNRLKTGWKWINPAYCELFNSYYNGIGRQHPRAQRALISRPDHAGVGAYRQEIDQAMLELINSIDDSHWQLCRDLIVLGLNHEQQHQELMLTDFKACLPVNILAPPLGSPAPAGQIEPVALEWIPFKAGSVEIGCSSDSSTFVFDNETPIHTVYLNEDYELANRLVNCEEYQQFIDAGGYQNANLWLADGWAWVKQHQIQQPLYWLKQDDGWYQHTLAGLRPIHAMQPVCHLNFYEASAFAEWQGARLPSEAEWEQAALLQPNDCEGHFADQMRFHPEPPVASSGGGLLQLFGTVWEWTRSSYAPYPGFRPAKGAIGEYNGKFMANQMVLRGGSCVTAPGHIRPTYRNFFYPPDRWQFTGLRLARDAE